MNIQAPDPHYTIGTLVQRIAALEAALNQVLRENEALKKASQPEPVDGD